jgi:cyanate lyase
LSTLSAFNNPIDSLPPGSEIIFGLAQGFVVFAEGADPSTCPTTFTVTAKYKFSGKNVEELHVVDLRPYLNADVPQDPVIRKLSAIIDSLGKLTEAVKSAS